MIIVVPTGEDHEDNSTTCPCCPRVEFGEDGEMIIIHNAFDGRE